MRADIHDGREHMLQSEAGYIDARPHHQDRQNLLHRTAGPYIRVKSLGGDRGREPVYVRSTSDRVEILCAAAKDAKCHSGLLHRSKGFSFDRLVSGTARKTPAFGAGVS
jgi:hypothetical protein